MATTLIRGGTVIDVEAGVTQAADVLIRNGIIAAIGESSPREIQTADMTFNANGLYVAPGFIDIHTHIFSHGLFETARLEADRVGVNQGVACVVDAGSSGASAIDAFPRFVHAAQKTPTYGLLNIGSPGLPNLGGGHSSRPDLVSLSDTVHAIERHASWVQGVKVQASASNVGVFGLEAVRIARKAADLTAKPLMAHIGNAPPVLDDTLDLLHPGDILTHAYHGKVGGVLTFGGTILPAFREAVKRGVIVDIGHGSASFSFAICERALESGMPVHTISTDLHQRNLDMTVISLARTMTKLRVLGMSLVDVVRSVTLNAARALRLDAEGFGRLAVGQPAHVTIFRERDGPLELEDSEGEKRTAEKWIEPMVVYVGGVPYERSAEI